MRIPLTSGAYKARSVIAAAQRCVNLYPEPNDASGQQPGAPGSETFPATYYPTPGSKVLATATDVVWRCLYVSTDNRLFGVVGTQAVLIGTDFSIKKIGTVAYGSQPVYMADNGVTILIVDGTPDGYTITLADLTFAPVTNDAFYGATRIAEVDGYLVLNRPNTNQWYISLFNKIDFDSLDFASKIGASDQLVAIGVTRRNLFLFGQQTTEVWTNTGGTDFTFSRVDGAFIQFGCKAPHSLCQADGSLYWVSQSPQGECLVLRTLNYDRERISTFAIENELQTYSTVADAIGYIQQMNGHYWYVLTFPTAGKTWVYDIATMQWHERAYLNVDGTTSRHRANCFAFWQGMHIVGDYADGRLYQMSADLYTDAGNPIRRIRGFPHMADDGNRVKYLSFTADMEAGTAPATGASATPEIRLRWSDSKGSSWSQHISDTIGYRGQYNAVAQFNRLGMGRDRVFELSWSADTRTALNGAYVDVQSVSK